VTRRRSRRRERARGGPEPSSRGAPAAAARARAGAPIRNRWVALALAFAAFLVYNVNGREAYPTGDSRPTGLLPFSILYEHDLDLDEYNPPEAPVSGPIRRENGHIVSNYSPLPAILSLPIYLPVLPFRVSIDGYMIRWEPFFAKLAGSIWAALAVAAFFLAASQVASQRAAALTALVLAFAGPLWMSGSQTLGQHGFTVLFGSLLLLGLARLEATGRTRWALAGGLACALAVGTRLSNFVVFAIALAYLLRFHPRRALAFAAPALVLGTPLAVQLLAMIGGTSGGLESFSFLKRIAVQFEGSMAEGLPGLLVSPGEGLFVWAPILILLLLPFVESIVSAVTNPTAAAAEGNARRLERRHGGRRGAASPVDAGALALDASRRRRLFRLSLVVFVALLLLYSKYTQWTGGRTYGPRYLTDALPFFLFPAAASLERWLRSRAFRVAFVALTLVSAYVQVLGAFRYPCAGDVPGRIQEDDARAWSWTETDIGFCARSPRRPARDFESAWQLVRMIWLGLVR
jgi:hypothetical protein